MVYTSAVRRNSTSRAPTASGASHSSRWPAPSIISTGMPPAAHLAVRPGGSSSSWSPHNDSRGQRDAVQASRLSSVAERPQQVRGGDVAQVAGDGSVVGTELAEAIDERLGHALREEVRHAIGGRHRIEVEALVVLVEDAERGEQRERPHRLGPVGREVDREHAADRRADDRARQAHVARVDRVPEHREPTEVVVGRDEVPAGVEALDARDDDVPARRLRAAPARATARDGPRCRRGREGHGRLPRQTAVAFFGHQGSSTSAKMPRNAGATLSPKSFVL